jgi:hypothetical protein
MIANDLVSLKDSSKIWAKIYWLIYFTEDLSLFIRDYIPILINNKGICIIFFVTAQATEIA